MTQRLEEIDSDLNNHVFLAIRSDSEVMVNPAERLYKAHLSSLTRGEAEARTAERLRRSTHSDDGQVLHKFPLLTIRPIYTYLKPAGSLHARRSHGVSHPRWEIIKPDCIADLELMEKEHSSSRSSTKGARSNYTASSMLAVWIDRYQNHGSTASLMSAMLYLNKSSQPCQRPLHQGRSCGSVLTSWFDCSINVDHVVPTLLFTTMARPPYQSRPCEVYKIINHGSTAPPTSAMWN
jgi:hypothetical protein